VGSSFGGGAFEEFGGIVCGLAGSRETMGGRLRGAGGTRSEMEPWFGGGGGAFLAWEPIRELGAWHCRSHEESQAWRALLCNSTPHRGSGLCAGAAPLHLAGVRHEEEPAKARSQRSPAADRRSTIRNWSDGMHTPTRWGTWLHEAHFPFTESHERC
jgi:hypothetical protein